MYPARPSSEVSRPETARAATNCIQVGSFPASTRADPGHRPIDRDTFLDFFLMEMVSFFLCGPGSCMHASRVDTNALLHRSVERPNQSLTRYEYDQPGRNKLLARGFEVTGSRLSTRSLARTCCSSLIPRPISICARNVLQ
jgi:hypothetical protein